MTCFRFLAAFMLVACALRAADAPRPELATRLTPLLSFERDHPNGTPGGWGGGPRNTLFADSTTTHGGEWSVRIERTAESEQQFSALTSSIPIDFTGSRVELRGFLRLADVEKFAGFWLRIDGAAGVLEFDNMARRQLRGTADWTEYSVTLPLSPNGRKLTFGVLLSGAGKVWADDLQLLVDGQPVWNLPVAAKQENELDRDKEFDGGSKISLGEISPAQADHLALLGQVWGFLKYHHPKVTAGALHWDYELFRVMPGVLAASDRAAAQAVLQRWVESLGELSGSQAISSSAPDRHLSPDLDWLNEKNLGAPLAASLRAVHAARPAGTSQFFVSFAPNVGNPVFSRELAYQNIQLPDTGHQLLGLFRFWNIIRYWFPYRDLIDEEWNAVLRDSIPRIGLAPDANAYQLELIALIARVTDTHANLWSSLQVRPPVGNANLPVVFRFIDQRPVVTQLIEGQATPLKRGDVLLALDGSPIEQLVQQWTPYYAASNEPTRLRDIARALGRGAAGPVKLQVQRDTEKLELTVDRVALSSLGSAMPRTHDRAGPAFQRLSPDVAYLKLSAVNPNEIASYVEQAAGTKGWIIDIRNYPASFVVFTLGGHFVEQPTEFVRFTTGVSSNPGEFAFGKVLSVSPRAPHYPGKIMILVDEVSQSNAEYTTMAFRVAPRAKVIGSTTAAADGNISRIPLPGGYHTMISGIGVFYPDKRPTQRVGIVPDIEVKPTLAGIRAGRDEVLARALQEILGPDGNAEEIARIAALPE